MTMLRVLCCAALRCIGMQGVDLTDEELIDHISQMCVMSKSLDDYEGGSWPASLHCLMLSSDASLPGFYLLTAVKS
jgi:hypothetical protein